MHKLPKKITANAKREFRKEPQVCKITDLVYDPGLPDDEIGYVYGNATDPDGFCFAVRVPVYYEEVEQELSSLETRLWRQCEDRFESNRIDLFFPNSTGFYIALCMAQSGIVPTLASVKEFQNRRLRALTDFDVQWVNAQVKALRDGSE